jgi:glycosyltransferase involved in cell wall biosynthesis
LIARLGIERRVHLLDRVPYEELTQLASGADAGLVVLDPAIENHRLSLPNRLFDYMASGLPVISPDIPDVARIVRERKFGVILDHIEAPSWARGISAALANRDAMGANSAAASQQLSWDTLGDAIHAAYAHAASITFIGYSRIISNNRTRRIVKTLLRRGVAVTVCCPHDGPSTPEVTEIRFVPTPLP